VPHDDLVGRECHNQWFCGECHNDDQVLASSTTTTVATRVARVKYSIVESCYSTHYYYKYKYYHYKYLLYCMYYYYYATNVRIKLFM
jgi:hypothetical protein